MSPFVSFLIKQLPGLIPVVEHLVKRTGPAKPDDDRMAAVEHSLDRLLDVTLKLEARVRRMTLLAAAAVLLAAIALVVAFVR